MKTGVLCILTLVSLVHGAAIARDENAVDKRDAFDMVKYLERYGYLPNKDKTFEDDGFILHSEEPLKYGLSKYKASNRLPVTGRMDRKTRDLMRKRRSVFEDSVDGTDPNKPQEYKLLDTKWTKNEITWKIVKWTNKLSHAEQRKVLENAFQYWADVTPLTFTYTEGTPDIEVKFVRGEHGDGQFNAFDGKGNSRAHAFAPGVLPISGDIHFDDDEDWTYHESHGTELQRVAAHELGHALGLGHSRSKTALMFPAYMADNPKFKLSVDDIRGIQALYGSNPGRPTTKTTTTSKSCKTIR